MERTDEQLAQSSIEGDTRAFGILVRRLREPLIGHMVGLLGTRDDAEELAQDAFLTAWQKLSGLREPAHFAGWVYRIARNLATKRAKALRTVPLVEDPPAPDGEQRTSQRPVAVLQAIARLSEPHREVISRKHFAGQSGDEIARHLAIPPGTVRSRLSRAYAELREILSERET